MTDEVEDPLLKNAAQDLDNLAERLGQELHAQSDAQSFKTRLLAVFEHYGPSLAEAAFRLACELGGVAPPPALPGGAK